MSASTDEMKIRAHALGKEAVKEWNKKLEHLIDNEDWDQAYLHTLARIVAAQDLLAKELAGFLLAKGGSVEGAIDKLLDIFPATSTALRNGIVRYIELGGTHSNMQQIFAQMREERQQ